MWLDKNFFLENALNACEKKRNGEDLMWTEKVNMHEFDRARVAQCGTRSLPATYMLHESGSQNGFITRISAQFATDHCIECNTQKGKAYLPTFAVP